MRAVIEKAARRLSLWDGDKLLLRCKVGLGLEPVGAKRRSGDMRTPEGEYRVRLIKPDGKYGRSIGLGYPNVLDAERGFADGLIDEATLAAIRLAHAENRRPPWGSPLGGEIYIHEGGSQTDWTAGCVALDAADMDALFPYAGRIELVEILP